MKTITRSQAIQDLHLELLKLVDEQSSLCQVAARRGLFCNGFERWSDEELEQRIPWEWQGEGKKTRAELLRLVNLWMLGLQNLRAGRLPCDLEADGQCRSPFCGGWEQFSESELGQFHSELCGEEIQVVADAALEPERALGPE